MLEKAKVLSEDGSIVDSTLRRNGRRKDVDKGFKASACSIKGCIGCQMKPPTLPPSIIRNLGSAFCKVDPALMTEEALGQKGIKKKKSAPSPSGKKPQKKKPKDD